KGGRVGVMRTRVVVVVWVGMLAAVGCSSSTEVVCGPGTYRLATVCLPSGDGSVPLDAAMLACGPGTVQIGVLCLPSATIGDGGVPDAGDAGIFDGGAVHCGPGTREEGGLCVPVAAIGYWDVRVGATTIPGDGVSHIPIYAIGRDDTGAPYTGEVVVQLTR